MEAPSAQIPRVALERAYESLEGAPRPRMCRMGAPVAHIPRLGRRYLVAD